MTTIVLTLLILVAIYFLQQTSPVIAGVLAVTPVKIVATSFIVFEDGGVSRLQEALGGMLFGQIAWSAALFLAWLALKS